jgi:hypothetical protein
MRRPPASFDLRFIIPASATPATCDVSGLVPYAAEAYTHGDTAGELPTAMYDEFKRVERERCAELKRLAGRFDGKEVIHFVVAFNNEDLRAVSSSDALRKHHVRTAMRSMIRSVEVEHEADRLDCVFAMHLDSEVPHVHVAMSRYASAGPLVMRVNTLPAVLFALN